MTSLIGIIVGALRVLCDWFLWVFFKLQEEGQEVLRQLLETASAAFPTVNWTSVQDILNQINYVFPLGEAVAMSSALFGIWIICMIYRITKSWIPFIGS